MVSFATPPVCAGCPFTQLCFWWGVCHAFRWTNRRVERQRLEGHYGVAFAALARGSGGGLVFSTPNPSRAFEIKNRSIQSQLGTIAPSRKKFSVLDRVWFEFHSHVAA